MTARLPRSALPKRRADRLQHVLGAADGSRLREELRKSLVESYRPRHAEGTPCAIFRHVGRLVSFHLIEAAGSPADEPPAGCVVMSSRTIGTHAGWHGSLPVCVGCAPSCKKCGLPVPTEQVLDVVEQARRRALGSQISLGNGHCRHVRWSSLFVALAKRLLRRGRFAARSPATPATAVVACLRELDGLRTELSSLHLGFSEIEPHVRTLIADGPRTTHSLEVDRASPRDLVLLLATNATRETLATGRFHSYRGALDLTGDQLLAIWDFAVSNLARSGFYTEEQAAKDTRWIREQVKKIG